MMGEMYKVSLDESVSLPRLTEAQQLNMLVRLPPCPRAQCNPCTAQSTGAGATEAHRSKPAHTSLTDDLPRWSWARSAAECDRF